MGWNQFKTNKNLGWLEVLTSTAGPNVSLFRFSETNPGGLGCRPVMMVNELPPKLYIASKWNIIFSFVTKGRVRFTRLWTRPMFHSNSYPWHWPFWYEYGEINSKSLTYFFQFISQMSMAKPHAEPALYRSERKVAPGHHADSWNTSAASPSRCSTCAELGSMDWYSIFLGKPRENPIFHGKNHRKHFMGRTSVSCRLNILNQSIMTIAQKIRVVFEKRRPNQISRMCPYHEMTVLPNWWNLWNQWEVNPSISDPCHVVGGCWWRIPPHILGSCR